ncbi:MAG: hypothetical protein HPY74_05415 [Firmicutes bacterium]|nr:hypothetical protein [Bacillota bacterium]
MKMLLWFELKKIYSHSLIYITMAVMMGLFYLFFFSRFLSSQEDWRNRAEIAREVYTEFGGTYAPGKVDVLEKEIERIKNNPGNNALVKLGAMESILNEYKKIRIIQERKDILSSEILSGNLSKSEMALASLELKMLKNLPQIRIEYYHPITELIDYFKHLV